MIRGLLNRLPIAVKVLIIGVGGALGIFFVVSLFIQRVSSGLSGNFGVDINLMMAYRNDFIRLVLSLVSISSLALFLVYAETMVYLKKIAAALNQAVSKKKLSITFDESGTNDIFESISHNANQLSQLFKSFDHMKSARVSMEVSSIKHLMNTVTEAVILVNKEKVITHLNHRAEQLFGLVPGESIGEAISRHISNELILEKLDQALIENKRTSELECSIKEGLPSYLTVLPIKDKYGVLGRAVLILKTQGLKS